MLVLGGALEYRLLEQRKYCVWLVLGNYPLSTEVTVPGDSWALSSLGFSR